MARVISLSISTGSPNRSPPCTTRCPTASSCPVAQRLRGWPRPPVPAPRRGPRGPSISPSPSPPLPIPIFSTSPSVSTLPASTSRTWYLSEDEPELMTSTSMGPPKPWLRCRRRVGLDHAGAWRSAPLDHYQLPAICRSRRDPLRKPRRALRVGGPNGQRTEGLSMTDNATPPERPSRTADPGRRIPTGVEGANPALDDTGNYKAAEVGDAPEAAREPWRTWTSPPRGWPMSPPSRKTPTARPSRRTAEPENS